MADRRIKDLVTTATEWASDDYLAMDGATNGDRKMLVSLTQPQAKGAIYITTPAATSPGDQVNYFKVAGTTALNNSESVVMNLDMPANNRIRYTGTETIHAHIAVSLSMTTASNNQVLEFRVYRYDDSAASGATLVHSNVQRKVGAATDVGSTAMHCDCLLDTNDYLEVHVKNNTSTDDITLEDMYVFVMGTRYVT